MGPSQLARSNSSTQCARSGVRKVERLQAQLTSRRRGDQLLHAVTDRIALPNGSCEFTLQIIDSVHGWSDAVGVYSRSSWAICVGRAPGRLRSSGERCAQATTAIQKSQVLHQEALLLQQVGYALATLAPSEWVEICHLRCALH